jgi:site-specific DNA-methyltransferase (adenine-specific)
MRYLCRLVTPSKGIVLDPFLGSGSTGIGATLEGFDFIGIELSLEYLEIAKKRISYWREQAEKEKENVSSQLSIFDVLKKV